MVVYLTGTKNNLQTQTSERLQNDLKVDEGDNYIIVDANEDTVALDDYIRNILETGPEMLLFPILKHYMHINRLAETFKVPALASMLGHYGVLIIDDEADQASLNTLALKNSRREAGEEEELSKTYEAITNLKKNK